jgi:hypothetical protein
MKIRDGPRIKSSAGVKTIALPISVNIVQLKTKRGSTLNKFVYP